MSQVEDFNKEQLPYGQQPYGQQPYGQPPYVQPQYAKPKKRLHPLLSGLIGGVLSLVFVFFLIRGYCFLTGNLFVIGQDKMATTTEVEILDSETVDKIEEVSAYIDLYFKDPYEAQKAREMMVKGLVDGLDDPYSQYYTAEEFADLQVSTSGNYYGIGAGLQQDVSTMIVTITKIYRGTPSEEAGLKEGDVILYVDGIDATTVELSQLVKGIRGEEGTTVKIQVYRESTGETLDFEVERRNVELPSVEGEMLEGNIAYIQVSEFQEKTAEQFIAMCEDFRAKGATSLIIDLRDNPGGMLSAVIEMLDYVLPSGKIVYTEDKYGNQDTYTSDSDCIDMPMVVLINGNSASASEIFAGAIKDYQYGTLLGTTTYGKGIVQTIYPLSDSDALKITTAKYYTPNGNFIHEVGIEPDEVLEYEFLGPEDGTYEKQYDNQLLRAIEILSK